MRPTSPTETIECPLCSGAGELTRAEVLDRLGAKDFARVAQLSAEEAFRLLQTKHDNERQSSWSRFEIELAKRTAEIRERHKDELRLAQSEKETSRAGSRTACGNSRRFANGIKNSKEKCRRQPGSESVRK